MTHFKIDIGFGDSLSENISFHEQSIDEIYKNTTENFLFTCKLNGYDKKEELVKLLVYFKKRIIDMMSEFVMTVILIDNDTNEKMEDTIIDGEHGVVELKKHKWDLKFVITMLTLWRVTLQEFIEVDSDKWDSNESVYIKTQNNLKAGYEDLNKICRAFVMYDIHSQLLKQV